ncbi:MAG TPA: hypothetical protein VGA60_10760 [Kiloniellales bacterium]
MTQPRKKHPKLLIGMIALLAMVGCESGEAYIDPPELFLDLGTPPARISQVEITNGAGQTVMSGRPNRDGDLTANPDLSTLDGTLTIKSTWTDGQVTTQTVTHTPNTRLSLTYNHSRNGYDVADAQNLSPAFKGDVREGSGN